MVVKVLRTVAGVLTGYIAYAMASMAVVLLLDGTGNPIFPIVAVPTLAVIGLISGFIAAIVSGTTRRIAGSIVAGLVLLAAASNLVMQLGIEPVWYKFATIVLTVPGILFVAFRRPRESKSGD